MPGVDPEQIMSAVVSLEPEYIEDKEVKWEGWLQKYAGDYFTVSQVQLFPKIPSASYRPRRFKKQMLIMLLTMTMPTMTTPITMILRL